MSCWSDQIFLTGGIVTARAAGAQTLDDIVRATGRAIGYVAGNAIDVPTATSIHDSVCQRRGRRRAVDATT